MYPYTLNFIPTQQLLRRMITYATQLNEKMLASFQEADENEQPQKEQGPDFKLQHFEKLPQNENKIDEENENLEQMRLEEEERKQQYRIDQFVLYTINPKERHRRKNFNDLSQEVDEELQLLRIVAPTVGYPTMEDNWPGFFDEVNLPHLASKFEPVFKKSEHPTPARTPSRMGSSKRINTLGKKFSF